MSAATEIDRLQIGKGQYIIFHRDDSKADDDPEKYYSLITCEGKPGDDTALEVPRHWHKHHDEYMSCEEGQIELYLDGKTAIARPGDAVVFIPRRIVHGFKFPKGQKAVLKERFFEDVFSNGGFWGAMRGMADGDTYPAMPGPFRWLDEVYILVMWVLVRLFHPRTAPVPKSVAPLVGDESKKEL